MYLTKIILNIEKVYYRGCSMGINIKSDMVKFKLRVSGIIIRNNEILVHKGKKFVFFDRTLLFQ